LQATSDMEGNEKPVPGPNTGQRYGMRLIPDKYLALIVWFILLAAYIGFSVCGKESKVIEGMLGAAFGALMMALQSGFKRMESSFSHKHNAASDE
jgi:hypothetical protein